MSSLRIIRRRLRSVQSTKQIMRAMQLVSGSKLRRAQGRLMQARMVLGFLDGLLQRVLAAAPPARPSREPGRAPLEHALCGTPSTALRVAYRAESRDATREGPDLLVVCTSDAGLCGSYNTNVIQLAESHLRRDTARRTQLVYIGKKGHRYFTRRGYAAEAAYVNLAGRPDPAKAEAIGRELMERFVSGRAGSVQLLYSRFLSPMVYRPTMLPWLPIQLDSNAPTRQRANAPTEEYIFEPSPRRIFE